MEKELEKLGFSANEAGVYLALLEIGQTTVGPIIKKTGLHRQVVYNTLANLGKNDLVQSTIKNNRQNFQIIDPKKIVDNLKKQETLAQDLLPDLLAKQKKKNRSQEVKVYEGIEGFQAMQLNNLKLQPENSTIYILGTGGTRWSELMQKKNLFNKYEKRRLEKNIRTEIISFEENREEVLKNIPIKDKRDLNYIKFISGTYGSPVVIQIWQDRVALITFTDPVLSVEVKNIEFVKNFEQYFNLLWGQETRTYKGEESLHNIFYNIIEKDLKKGDQYYVIGANWGHKKVEGIFEFFKEYHANRSKSGIKANLLFAPKYKEDIKHHYKNFNHGEVRYMPSDSSSPMQIVIYKNKTIMMLFEDEPLIFVIENERISQAYKLFFDSFWATAQKEDFS